jgi:hypothetical protein
MHLFTTITTNNKQKHIFMYAVWGRLACFNSKSNILYFSILLHSFNTEYLFIVLFIHLFIHYIDGQKNKYSKSNNETVYLLDIWQNSMERRLFHRKDKQNKTNTHARSEILIHDFSAREVDGSTLGNWLL